MSDLKKYITGRKKKDRKFAEGRDEGYERFKLGVVLRQAREDSQGNPGALCQAPHGAWADDQEPAT